MADTPIPTQFQKRWFLKLSPGPRPRPGLAHLSVFQNAYRNQRFTTFIQSRALKQERGKEIDDERAETQAAQLAEEGAIAPVLGFPHYRVDDDVRCQRRLLLQWLGYSAASAVSSRSLQRKLTSGVLCSAARGQPPFFGKHHFTYDPEADVYHCPGDQTLRFRTHKHSERIRIYRSAAAACNACRLKSQCTTNDHGRHVRRSLDEAYVERVQRYHATEAYQKAMRKRQVWGEPLFAEAKAWHGLRRFRLRGLANVNSEGLLIAAGQNLKRFLAASGWGRRTAPCGSLVALPREPWRLLMAFAMMADQIRTASWDPRFLAAVLTAKGFFNT